MPEMPRTKFNSPWTVANIEAELNGVKDARGSGTLSAALSAKVDSSDFAADQQRQEEEIGVVANAGAKNLLKVTSSTQTINGVTFIINDDQTITINGTASANTTYIIALNAQAILIQDGDYILSGCPSGGGPTTFDLRWYLYSPGKSAYDMGSGATVNKNGNTTESNIAIVIRSGLTANNLVFKPMIRQASITDSTFVPYAKTNVELTVENDSQQSEIDYAVNTGVKNLLNPVLTDTSVYGVTAALNDGVITLNGKSTNSSGSTFRLALYQAGSAWLSGCILSGIPVNSEGVYMNLEKSGSPYTRYAHDTGNGAEIGTLQNNETFVLFIRAPYNVQLTNFEVKPMIRPGSIVDSTFVPYAKTNVELTVAGDEDRAALVAQVDNGAKNLLEMTSKNTTITRYGVTATYDKAAGTITLTGTHVNGTSAAIFEFYSGNAVDQKIIPAGVYRLSGCPSGGSTSTFRGSLTQIASAIDIGNGATFTLTEPHYIAYRILISGDCDFTGGAVFKPMLCTASDYAISHAFVPYRPSWQELYEMILALQNGA